MDALNAFRENSGRFELVITDHHLPGTSGLSVAAELLTLRPDVPVLLHSNQVTGALRQRACDAGIRAVLLKPNTLEELSETIRRLTTETRPL